MAEVYIVTMYRNGDAEAHSYVLGVFADFATATEAADREVCDRVGKYAPMILAMEPNQTEDYRIVLPLPDQRPHVKRWINETALFRRLRKIRYA